jgi:DNA-binding PadR family transcriptional regulator
MNPTQPIEQDDTELSILENIYSSAKTDLSPRQRDLATSAGASLGMTNAILKRLAGKGWIVVRKINSRKAQYAVTPDGVNEIARRSYRYFKRTIRNVVFYRDRIDEAIARAKVRGADSVLLVGVSELDFIVEHSCDRHALSFLKAVDEDLASRAASPLVFLVYAEEKANPDGDGTAALYLSDVLSGSEKER